MDNQKNNKGVIALLIIIIIILSVLCALFATGTISFKSNNPEDNKINENTDNNKFNDEANNKNDNLGNENNSEYNKEPMTNVNLDIFWDGNEYEIKVTNGKLEVENKVFSIPNEKIKYFYFNRYQCSNGTVFYYLTEEGNIYVTDISNYNNKNIELLNNFKKLDYSNVSDIVILPNENYGKPLDDVSGMIDNVKEYFYAFINGEVYKLDYQYRC